MAPFPLPIYCPNSADSAGTEKTETGRLPLEVYTLTGSNFTAAHMNYGNDGGFSLSVPQLPYYIGSSSIVLAVVAVKAISGLDTLLARLPEGFGSTQAALALWPDTAWMPAASVSLATARHAIR